ncbi:alpha/beta hydrolase [Kocuria arenosa]|uniref:alpha/beta hydrolase n=1 Tax=Kocuria arenosa TaxID=3071446 RepID=UPI0034D3D102
METAPRAVPALAPAVGIVLGLVLSAAAVTPSLLPRPAVFQGFLAGVGFTLGYGAGTLAVRLLVHVAARRRAEMESLAVPASRRVAALGWVAAVLLAILGSAGLSTLVIEWQNEVRANVDMPPRSGAELVPFLAVWALTSAVGLALVRSLGSAARRFHIIARRRGAGPAGAAAVSLLGAGALLLLLCGLVVGAAVAVVNRSFAARDATTPEGVVEPGSRWRSAGPDSLVRWDSLGMQGRAFIGGGPVPARIEEVAGRPARAPVRVYVGLDQAPSVEERAALAVEELHRTGGFDREVLVVATPTGSGWLERQAVDAVEYLNAGDTAIVATQYSYRPSWYSFLFDPDLARDSSRALFDAVHTEWERLPAGDRPQLVVYGLSLGASGMQSVFEGIPDMAARTDGAVFTGPPNNAQPWRSLQQDRDPGSPVWRPVLDQGRTVRWLSNPGDFEAVPGPWERPRIAYLQHATDPITWLDPAVIWQRPEWLAGSQAQGGRAADVSDSMVWIPGLTYLQLAVDMVLGEAVPAGHGHNYGDVAVDAWAGVLPEHGLDSSAVDRLRDVIAAYPFEDAGQV